MPTPTRHDASNVAFLVSGMDRDCGCPWQQGRPHGAGLGLPRAAGAEEDPDAWREGAYTVLLMMDLDFITNTPLDTDMYQHQHPDDSDNWSLDVLFDDDDDDLDSRDIQLDSKSGSH